MLCWLRNIQIWFGISSFLTKASLSSFFSFFDFEPGVSKSFRSGPFVASSITRPRPILFVRLIFENKTVYRGCLNNKITRLRVY